VSEAHVCIHAHFYQPPRENPWLDEVEPEPSASPFHDWNERITVESYVPNGGSRIVDGDGRIRSIRNNYGSISFNFGPTLLGWMESRAPAAYSTVLEADIESLERFGGHGSALAQPYHHMIMPLATPRDRRTQVVWGVSDFRRRFGRMPEGMWLPETAVDLDTLEALAEQGIRFTILAPHQAARVRATGGEWQEVEDAGLDTTVAYRQSLPSGREIALFFYDGAASRAVAFDKLLENGEALAAWLTALAHEGGDGGPGLAHIATDGETYGHHHGHGDMALAAALERIESEPGIRLTNYAQFLAEHPPVGEVEIRQNTSWSCAHGVERWRSDCGCSTGGEADWNQTWRAPLREALDALSDDLARVFEDQGAPVLMDPWRARDAYIEAILGTEAERVRYLDTWCTSRGHDERTLALRLLEMQRCAMLMFTSCGWFFNDLAGIETRQILRYAARALDLAESVGEGGLREPFLTSLSEARANGPHAPDGREVLDADIKSARFGALDFAAGWIARLAADVPLADYAAWRVSGKWAMAAAPDARAVAGVAQIKDVRTGERRAFRCRALTRGPNDVRVRVQREGPDSPAGSVELELTDLRPGTRAAIGAERDSADQTNPLWDETIRKIWSALEGLGSSGPPADRERILAELDALMGRAEAEAIQLPLWDLQNCWWRWASRPGASAPSELEETVARRLGFPGRGPD
jgi:alpha-amylase/alpha-mannosidase (GH57 family)